MAPNSVADSVRVAVVLADFANADSAGKANILGAAWSFTGLLPNGLTPAQALVVLIEVAPQHLGEQFAVSCTLVNEAGDPVMMPGPTGELQALRVQQLVHAETPRVPGVVLPSSLPGRTQVILNLGIGLPIPPGLYRWVVEVDGNANPQWGTTFCVAAPPPSPVIG